MPKFWSVLFGGTPTPKSPITSKPPERDHMVASYAEPMKWIVDKLADQLRTAGFKRKRNAFNRHAQDGIVHQISFDQVPAWSTGHGLFTIHGGIYVPAGDIYKGFGPKSDWINSYDCAIRGIYGPGRKTRQHDAWPVSCEPVIIAECCNALSECVSILDRYRDLESVFSEGLPRTPFEHEIPRGILLTCIHLSRNRKGEAHAQLRSYLSARRSEEGQATNPRHLAHVVDWASGVGLEVS